LFHAFSLGLTYTFDSNGSNIYASLSKGYRAGDYGFGRMMVNAGKSYNCGIEASLRGSVVDNRLSWGINYGLTHAVFKEYADDENDYSGKKVPFVPMHI